MIKSIGIQPKEFLPSQSLILLEGLSKYKNGELLSIMIIGKEALIFRISDDNDPNSETKRVAIQILLINMIQLNGNLNKRLKCKVGKIIRVNFLEKVLDPVSKKEIFYLKNTIE